MVRVNGNKFKIYELDDLESFENRLSYQMETLGKYLYFENDVKETDIFNKKNNIIVENILDTIKNSALNNDSVMDLIKNIRYKVGDEKFDKSKQIIIIWLLYNKKLQNDIAEQGDYILNTIGDILYKENIYISNKEIYKAWKDVDRFKKSLERDIEINTENVRNTLDIFREYDTITEGVAITEFTFENIAYKITYNIQDITLFELFNYVKLTKNVPFISANNYYKILNEFIPPYQWGEGVENAIVLYINNKIFYSSLFNIDNYSTSILKIDDITKYITSYITVNISET